MISTQRMKCWRDKNPIHSHIAGLQDKQGEAANNLKSMVFGVESYGRGQVI